MVAGGGERKLVTMLFADLSGYTALAEQLDPEDVYAFLRPTMSELQTIVESFGGSVPQIQGDGFMAVFGVPHAHEDDAERAMRAGLAVRDRIHGLNADRDGLRLPEVHAGVNSGEVMVGPSREVAGFAVVGDTVNTAARIAGFAGPGEVLASESTRRLTTDAIRYGPARRRRAKGKAAPVVTSEALGLVVAGPVLTPSHGFVDREDILGRLGRELEEVERSGSSRVVVVVGEPGIGKSRLALELAPSIGEGRFLIGRCPPFGDPPPLVALGEAIRQAIGVDPGTQPAEASREVDAAAERLGRGRAGALAADLRTLLGIDGSGPARSERDAVRAARIVLEDLARGGVVTLVLDDLQWADPSLRAMLAELAEDPWPVPLLLIGCSREPIHGVPVAPLPALDEPSMRLLAEVLLGEEGSADAVRVPITRANGNALFLEEMVGMLVESGAVAHGSGGWTLAEPAALEDVPASIRLVIAARLDRLPEDEKQVLVDASVFGAAVRGPALDAISDVDDVDAALAALVSRDLLRPRPGSDDVFAFKHALIRDVAYDALPRATRAERHRQVAAWLERSAPKGRAPVGEIAFHRERAWTLSARDVAGRSDEAGRAAAAALSASADHMFRHQAREAEPLFRRSLAVADELGDAANPLDTARAAVGLAEVLIEMGSHAEAIEAATRARNLARRAGDDGLVARALLALGRSESDAGRMRRARTLLEDARARFEAAGDLRGQGWALHRLSETWGWSGFDRELDDLRAAYAMFTKARDGFGRSVVAHDLAYILSVEGGPEFRRWYEQARRLAEDDGDLRSRALLLRTLGHHRYSSGSFGEAVAVMAECRPVAAEAGDRYAEADGLAIGALAGANVVGPDEVAALAEEAIALGRELGSLRTPALARFALARAHVRSGHPDLAVRSLRTARDAVRRRHVRVMYADVAEAEASVALDRGAWARAATHGGQLAAALRAIPMGLWRPLPELIAGRAALGAGRHDEALVHLDAAIGAARAAPADGWLGLARPLRAQAAVLAGRRPGRLPAEPDPAETEVAAIHGETAGVIALAGGDPGAAVTALDLAVERWEPLGLSSWLARSLALRAEALRACGDRARAAASVARARSVADRIGMPSTERSSIESPLERA